MTYAYDAVNRVLDVNAKRGTTAIADYAYTRDTIGRVTTLVELTGRTVSYGYSTAGRLVNETIAGDPHGVNGTIAYTHDPVGNRLTRTSTVAPIPAQTFAYDANDRITTETYDANGNTLSSDGDAFLYDFEDRLIAINSGVTLSYDAAGKLGSRTEAGTKVGYLVDEISPAGYTQVVEEMTGGVVSKSYAYGRMPLRSGGQSYIADGHADVRILADASGSVTDVYDYEAFGVGTRTAGSSPNLLRYSGERTESAGLTFLRARHMKNGRGRFCSTDPVRGVPGEPASLGPYFYAGQEPLSRTDPSGKSWSTVIAVSAAVAILGTSAVLVHKGVTRRSNAEQDKKGSLGPLSSYEGLPGFEAKLRSDFAALVGDVYVESSIVAGPGAPPKELKSGSGGPYFSGLSRVDILVFNFGDGDQVGGTIAGTDQILLSDRVVEKCSKAKNYDSRACVLVYQFVIAEYLHTAQGGAHVDADEDIDDITQQLVRQTPWGPPEPGGLHGK